MAKSLFVAAALAATAALAAGSAAAQTYPTKPVRIIVSSAAGGPLDVPARWIANKLTDMWGVGVVVDNRGGAAGNIAYEAVAHAPADGTYLLYVTNAFLLSAITSQDKSFDHLKDFAPVARIASGPTLFVARPGLGFKNVKDLIAYAKKNPGKLTYGSQGIGGTQHLYGEMFKALADVDMLHVPYKGAAPAMNDLLAARLDTIFLNAPSAIPLMQSGKIIALGNAGMERSQALPDLPTLNEQGVKGFDGGGRHGISTTAKTPPAVITKIHDSLAKVLATPETKKAFSDAGLEPTMSTPAEFDAWIKSQIQNYKQVIKKAGISLDQLQ